MAKKQILSPLPGTFYRKPSPESPAFKENGDSVAAGDTVGLVEVMKNFQEVPAGVDGTNIRFIAEDGDAIMPGQPIAEVDE